MSGGGEDCPALNNQRPWIESHLGHHSDTDMESIAIADEERLEMNWPHIGNDAGRSSRGHRLDAVTEDTLSCLLDRRQQLEVNEAVYMYMFSRLTISYLFYAVLYFNCCH